LGERASEWSFGLRNLLPVLTLGSALESPHITDGTCVLLTTLKMEKSRKKELEVGGRDLKALSLLSIKL